MPNRKKSQVDPPVNEDQLEGETTQMSLITESGKGRSSTRKSAEGKGKGTTKQAGNRKGHQ